MTTPPRTQAERNADNALDVNRLRARNAELEAAVARVRALGDGWEGRAVSMKAFALTVPEDVREEMSEAADNWLWYAETLLRTLATPEPVETLHGRDDETGGKS